MNRKDLLVIARPDHSYNIYTALWNSSINYTYMVFKLFPKWLNWIFAKKKLRILKCDYSICWSMSLINTLHYNLQWNFLSRYPESRFYEPHIKWYLRRHSVRMIHYWPEYCTDYIRQYRLEHPEVYTVAEIVFLCERYVLDNVGPYLDSLGLSDNMDYIRKNAKIIEKVMKFENNFIVPSELAAETFRKYYPDKNYFVHPYGISVSDKYKKKDYIHSAEQVSSFVYAGTVSVEKGCDMLCKWFSENNDKELHLYGHLHPKESHLFGVYKSCKNIHFHGAVPKAELQQHIVKYDAGIHLSRFDSYSLSVAEIIGSGLPVIVSDMTGICSDVQKYNFGQVTPLEERSISDAIMSFSKPTIYNSYIDSIDKYISEHHVSYGEGIVAFYENILSKTH